MLKQGAPRTTKPTNGSAARTRRNGHAQNSTQEEAPQAVTLSHDELAARAYTLFLARGGRLGTIGGIGSRRRPNSAESGRPAAPPSPGARVHSPLGLRGGGAVAGKALGGETPSPDPKKEPSVESASPSIRGLVEGNAHGPL